MHACTLHPTIRILCQLGRRRTTRLSIRPDTIPGLPQTQRQKHRTHFGHNPTQDNLLPPGRLHSSPELRVIPRIDLAVAFDQRCVGIHLRYFLRQGAVGTCFGGSGHYHGQGEEFTQLSVGEYIVAEFSGRVVFDKLEEAQLMVDN